MKTLKQIDEELQNKLDTTKFLILMHKENNTLENYVFLMKHDYRYFEDVVDALKMMRITGIIGEKQYKKYSKKFFYKRDEMEELYNEVQEIIYDKKYDKKND